MKILIVDDDPNGLYMLEVMLKGSGYEVAFAANGAEALEKLNAEDFDVIISDILMPVMDGFQLCRKVKGNKDLNHILFIFYTATYTEEKDEDLALKTGADKFIRKPVEPDEFIKIVQSAILDMERGKSKIKPWKADLEEEKEVFNLYSERLVKKLEKKMLDLEKEINQRKLAEEALLESEARFRTIVEKIPAITYAAALDEYSSTQYISPQIESILGFTREEFKANNNIWDKQLHPDDRERVLKEIAASHQSDIPFVSEYRMLTKNGRIVWFRDEAVIVEDVARKPLFLQGIMCDITERRQAEEALLESEGKYRSLTDDVLDSSAVAIFILDSDFRVVWVNRALEDYFGLKRDEIIGKDKRQLIRERIKDIFVDPDGFVNKLFSTYDDNTYIEQFECHVIANGEREERWLEHRSQPIQSGLYTGGRIEHYYDITERKQAEGALLNSEERLARAVEGNSIPTFLIDTNHFITHWNKSCENLTGISAAEIIGTQKAWSAFYAKAKPIMADFIVDEATEKEIAGYYEGKYSKSILTEGAYEEENFFPDLGEKGKWLFLTAAPLRDQEEKVVGAIETFQDITERKSMEDQLRQAQNMEAIGTLAGGVAHDFNNILTIIIGNADLALKNVDKDDPSREDLGEIKIAAERAASLTRQLLAFSRKQIITPRVLDLNELLTDIEKMLSRLVGEDIELLTIPEPALWQVQVDPGQMEQVIMNLTVNARDAMPTGGKLTIETANIDLAENYFYNHGIKEQPGSYVMLAVIDTGSGMDEKIKEHIFDPFFTTKEQGTGLGLSTVYGIVKQNNGFVWVYSEPGHGTTFKVYLPMVKGEAELEEKQRTPIVELGGSETLLIVEDDDSLRKLVRNALQQHGYRVLDAENGEDALRVSQEHEGPIDLMITDVLMPRMGGKEAADRLQHLYPQMKVIYMSGYTDNAIVQHGVLEPGLNFLEKPFSAEGLAHKVREVLDQEDLEQ